MCGKYIHYEVRALLYEYSGLQVCVDYLETIYCRLEYRQDVFCVDGFAPCWLGATFEPHVHLASPLEGNLFPSCYCIDVFLFTLQEQNQTVACETVYRLHEIRVSSTRVSSCDTAGGTDGAVGGT